MSKPAKKQPRTGTKKAKPDYGGYVGAALKRLDNEAREKRKQAKALGKKETTGEKIAADRLWADNLYVTERATLAKQIDRAIRRAVREAFAAGKDYGNERTYDEGVIARQQIETRYGVTL